MATPSEKSPALEQMADEMSEMFFGRKRTTSIKADICAMCGKEAKEFKDNLSCKEYTISGLCQRCQDLTFVER